MKRTFALLSCTILAAAGISHAQPTDNPVAAHYGTGNYPAWVDGIQWDNVIDVTTDVALTQVAVANDDTKGAQNFAAFEEAREILYAAGGGVLYFPAGTYHFSLPDAGYGEGIGPLSRGLMLKEGIVIRGDTPSAATAIVRNESEKLDTDHDLQPTTIFQFPFQTRGTVPANATGVNDEDAGTADAAGEVPTDWNFIGMMPGANETGVSDVDNVGIVNVGLVGGTIVFGFDTEWATHMGASGAKWEAANFKVDWPAGSAGSSEDWINRVPDGQHYMDLINGRSGWTKFVESGSGRLVMNVKILDGAPWNDMMYADRKTSSTTVMPVDAFSHYRFAGRVIAYGSNVFIANNVIAKPERNFVHVQKQSVGDRAILFDYANHLGIDINKSLLGGNQDNATVHVIDGDGYYASNIVVKDNWVFNRGNKGFEISGHHVVIQNNHNERYVASNNFPYEYITNPAAYPSAVEGGDINAGGISFDGYVWQSTESASDYLSRGYDLGGMDVWVDNCTVINTGSRGNDGEAILGQRHNNIETLSWAITNSKFGPYMIDDTSSSSSGANAGYIGPYDMHSVGLFLTGNEGPGNIGMLKPESNYMLDGTWFNNAGTQATPATGHSDDWLAPGKAAEPHADPVAAPVLSGELNTAGDGMVLTWTDSANNELGFRVEKSVGGGPWETVAYRPRASENGALAYPDASIGSAKGQFDVGDVVHTQWTDYLVPTSGAVDYQVVAINANNDDSTGVSNTVSLAGDFAALSQSFDDLTVGEISGQSGWTIDAADSAKATVEAGALVYTGGDGAVLDGGTQHLALTGSADAKMNNWLQLGIDPALTGTTYMRALISSSDKGISTDRGELFIRLASWNLYVAAKFYDGVLEMPGSNVLEVDTTNGLPLDVTHMVLLKLNVEAGVVTSVDLWLNPDFADAASPDLTASGLSVDLSSITTLEMRSQNTLTRVDELLLAESWAEVVPEYVAPPFESLEASFDDLAAGENITGQGGWTIDAADSAKATVEAGALVYTAGDGAVLDGGTQHLALTGSADAKMNNWLQLGIDPPLDGTTYVRALISSSDKGSSTDRGELFLRLASWNLYVAAKFYDGVLEMPGSNVLEVDTTNGLPLDVAHMVLLKLNVEAGVVTSVDLWLNPDFADEASPDLTAGGLSVDLSSITTLEMRSQNTLTRVDELLLAESWAEVVPAPFSGITASFDDLSIGSIDDQGGWSINDADADKVNVAAGSLTYTAPDGADLGGGTQHLVLTGSPSAKMNNWLQLGIDPALTGTTYMRALISSSDKGASTDRGELFIRLASWNLYVAAKFYDGVLEMPGSNVLEVDTTNGLPLDVTHMVLVKLNVESGVVTSADLWLNPIFADEASPDLTAGGLSVDLSSITTLELRSQNTETRVDEILFATSWAELVPEAAVATPPTILTSPASADVEVGEAVNFVVTAAGTAPLSYQWRKDGADITGATDATYAIAAAQLEDAGDYDVVVTNSVDSATSAAATLTVTEPVVSEFDTLFLETFDSGATAETVGAVDIATLGWNVHHSYAGVYLPGLATGADAPNDILVFNTSTQIGDPDLGEPYGYVGFFINNYPLYGEGSDGARPALPGPHPDTSTYFHNRTLSVFLWKDHTITEDERARIEQFNFVQGNRDASMHNFFPAVEIDGQWYVYVVDQATLGTDVRILGRAGQVPNGAETVFSGDQFSENGEYANYYNAQPYSFTWSESGWTPLTFDGDTDTNSTVGMTLGTTLAGELPAGDITALGVYSPENIDPGYNFNGYRLDSIEVLASAPPKLDLFTFTFNNEGRVNGSDRPIQAADWDGVYSSAALPLVTGDAVMADLSEGVSSDETPGHYKAGFLFVAGKNGQPAPEGFLAYSTNTNVVDSIQSNPEGVNPQTDWYSDPINSVTNLTELALKDLQELQMRIRPRNADIRYHFAIQVGGEWYVSEEALQHSGTDLNAWESVSLNVQSANWLSGVVGESSVNFDFVANAPSVMTVSDIGSDTLLDTVGIYIDTDSLAGESNAWARVDSITLSAYVPDLPAPVISEDPADVGVVVGGTAEFSVVVADTTGVTYQWRKDGVAIANETSATLTLAGVVSGDAGDYDVVVTGPGGSITSNAATLEVYALPVVSPDSFSFDAALNDELVTITANAAVSWTAVSNDDWITVTFGASGSGSGLVGIQAAANDSTEARSGSLLIGGTTVTVDQAGMPLPATFEELVGAVEQGDGSYLSSWFGSYTMDGGDWIAHEDANWLYTGHAVIETDMLLYSYYLKGWIWSTVDAWPLVYDFSAEDWVFYIVFKGDVYLYSASSGDWSF